MQVPNRDVRRSYGGSTSRLWPHAVHKSGLGGQSHGTIGLHTVTVRGPAYCPVFPFVLSIICKKSQKLTANKFNVPPACHRPEYLLR